MADLPETDPRLGEILQQLIDREPIFHRPEMGTRRTDFDSMMVEDFWEVGASGRQYGRGFILDMLEERHKTPQVESLRASDFRCRPLGLNHFLLTYTLLQGERKTRTTTIWQQSKDGWKIVYHQGTVVAE